MRKNLYDISLQITEDEYRNDGTLHYSTLTTFERGGFHSIPTLNERKESPSLTLGSVVDCLMTDGEEAFNNTYVIAEYPDVSDVLETATKSLFNTYNDTYSELNSIPDTIILSVLDDLNYGKTWMATTRIKKIKESCGELYKLLYLAKNKTLISSSVYVDACNMVNALRESPATGYLFNEDNDPEVERLFQAKFRMYVKRINADNWDIKGHYGLSQNEIDNLLSNGYMPFTIMADEILVLHSTKTIIPIDLKTSSHYEDEFFKSFIEWYYHCQARSYAQCILANIKNDEYFKDFKMLDYHFVVVNKNSLVPMVWKYPDTYKFGTLYYGTNKQIKCRHPFDIGEDLTYYYNHPEQRVAKGLSDSEPNDLLSKLNEL